MSVLTRPPIVTNGLVLHLDAANRKSYPGTGTTWFDLSGNNNSGSLVNGPVWNQQQGGGITFDANDDYIDLGNLPLYNITSVNAYTINCWFYNGYPNLGIGLIHKGQMLGNYDYMIYLTGNDLASSSRSITFYKRNSIGTGIATNTIVIEPYKIYNYCVVLDSNNVLEYLNGTFQQTTVFTGDIRTTANPLKIGRGWNGTMAGKVYTTQIYNRALSAQEVLQNYNATKARFGL